MKIFRKILLVTLMIVVVLAAAPLYDLVGLELPKLDFGFDVSAEDIDSWGKCGDNVIYTYDKETKKLVISGTGSMNNGSAYNSSPFYDSDVKTIVIEKGVTTIGDYAFYSCKSLKKIVIPDGVTSIGKYAFYDCINLSNVSISGSVKSIKKAAFAYCSSLKKIVIPDGVTSIGIDAFAYCTSITDVSMGSSVKSIKECAFMNCKSLEKIVIPDGVENIDGFAFYSCSKLADITLPDSLTYIGDMAFYDTECYKNSSNRVDGTLYIGNYLIEVGYPYPDDFTVRDGVRLIADAAFKDCISLRTVSIPDSVKYINNKAFSLCSDLTEIALPSGIERIESETFYKTGLTKIYIPKTVKYISGDAFDSKLKEIYYEGSSAEWDSIECPYTLFYKMKYDHSHEITKTHIPATKKDNGANIETCVCGYLKNTTLYKIDTIKFKKATYFYTGEVITPIVVIKDSAGNTLKENVDYTVTIKDEIKNVGEYNVNINFINNYSGKETVKFNVYDETNKITLNSKKVILGLSQTFTVEPTVTPATAKQTVKYSTSNKAIATVSSKGVIKGIAAGKATITVTTADNKTAKVTVEVCNVKLKATSKTMNIGQTYTLKLSNSKFKVSKWSSSDSKIAKVDSNGLITAKGKGTATITAKLSNGIKFTCKVTVKKVSLSATKATVNQYNYKYLTLNNALGTVKWSSSNTKVATVNSMGKVVGVSAGTATITATYLGVKYNCTVTIKKQAPISFDYVGWSVNYLDGVKPRFNVINNTNKDIKYMVFYVEFRNKYSVRCCVRASSTSGCAFVCFKHSCSVERCCC